jgi:hypothetical protein
MAKTLNNGLVASSGLKTNQRIFEDIAPVVPMRYEEISGDLFGPIGSQRIRGLSGQDRMDELIQHSEHQEDQVVHFEANQVVLEVQSEDQEVPEPAKIFKSKKIKLIRKKKPSTVVKKDTYIIGISDKGKQSASSAKVKKYSYQPKSGFGFVDSDEPSDEPMLSEQEEEEDGPDVQDEESEEEPSGDESEEGEEVEEVMKDHLSPSTLNKGLGFVEDEDSQMGDV